MRRECSSVSRANMRPSSARSAPGATRRPDEDACESVALDADALCLGEGLTHQATAPQREPAREARVGGDGLAHDRDGELGLARVLEDADDERAGVLVDVARDLAVEVLRRCPRRRRP